LRNRDDREDSGRVNHQKRRGGLEQLAAAKMCCRCGGSDSGGAEHTCHRSEDER
jgi:hypothetical protein